MTAASDKTSLPFLNICWLFFVLGCTCFGGMWAAMDRLQRELVERRQLISLEDQRSLMLAAAMIPAPKFLAFAAMVGYRNWWVMGGRWFVNFDPVARHRVGLGCLCIDSRRV